MADTVFQTGILRQVFNPAGRADNGKMRFRLANFQLLQWASQLNGLVETYVVPTGINTINSVDVGAADRDIDIGREFGFYADGDDVIVDTHQGDGSDSLIGLHSFGIL